MAEAQQKRWAAAKRASEFTVTKKTTRKSAVKKSTAKKAAAIAESTPCTLSRRVLGIFLRRPVLCARLPILRNMVSFQDSEKTEHAVEVDSLYAAVAFAVAYFREDPLLRDGPAPSTEFTVAVLRNPTEHKIRLQQVAKWAEHSTKEGPAGIVKRERVRTLLNRD